MKLFKIVGINLSTLIFILILTTLFSFSNSEEINLLRDENIISIAKGSAEKPIIYAASYNTIYKSQDEGLNWQKIYNISNANKRINDLFIDSESGEIYAAAQNGLYYSQNQGIDWQRIFIGSSDLENDCLSVVASDKTLYLGTKQGLFVSDNKGRKWIKSSDQFSDSVVSLIAGDSQNERISYLACEKGIFKTEDDAKTWERIYVVYGSEIPSEDYSDYDGDISDKIINVKSMAISKINKRLYIATQKGIFYTDNRGTSWQGITNFGLLSSNIRSMAVSSDGKQLFVATDKGAFRLFDSNWHKIVDDFTYQDFNDLVINDGVILLAGKGGVFKVNIKDSVNLDGNYVNRKNNIQINIEDLFEGEPMIEQVQKAAIEYAEVNMNKIKSWRKKASLKALLPTVSVGYDKNVYGSSSGAMAIGPRSWDIDFSWDVGELIWNSDQTSIDSRSRLTVQLRQDVLDQVTRLYYERQRLKLEFLLSPPQEKREQLTKQIEIKEVTANIDALTNGFFSKLISKTEQ